MDKKVNITFLSLMILSMFFFAGIINMFPYGMNQIENTQISSQLNERSSGPIEDPDPPPPPPPPSPPPPPPPPSEPTNYDGVQSGLLKGLYFPKARYSKIDFKINAKSTRIKMYINIDKIADIYERFFEIFIDGRKVLRTVIDYGYHNQVSLLTTIGEHTLTLQIQYGGYKECGWRLSNISSVSGVIIDSVYFPLDDVGSTSTSMTFDFKAGISTTLGLTLSASRPDNTLTKYVLLVDGTLVYESPYVDLSSNPLSYWNERRSYNLGRYSLGSIHRLTIKIYEYHTTLAPVTIPLGFPVNNHNYAEMMYAIYGDGVVRKWAVIVGISDYNEISDLSFCDEDATDWYNYLHDVMHYNYIRVYGDKHTSHYPIYTGLATEDNVTAGLNWLANADADDHIAFISAGHGDGDGKGSSYLCMWNCSESQDELYDTELGPIVRKWAANNIFIFVDHCYSGGLIPECKHQWNYKHLFMTTTCKASGVGFDSKSKHNGAWTYYFLEYGLIELFNSQPHVNLALCFERSREAYNEFLDTEFNKNFPENWPQMYWSECCYL